MADVAEIAFMTPANLTAGTDVYKGVTAFRFRKNAPRTYRHIPEGSMTPTHKQQIPNPEPAVTGSLSYQSIAVAALAGEEAASVTIEGVNGANGNTVDITLTNVTFMEMDGDSQRDQPGQSAIAFEADDIDIVEDTGD